MQHSMADWRPVFEAFFGPPLAYLLPLGLRLSNLQLLAARVLILVPRPDKRQFVAGLAVALILMRCNAGWIIS